MSKIKPTPIVINRMFTGDRYLNDNIGHEIINLFVAEDDENYIYFCDKGTYNFANYKLPKYSIQVRPSGVGVKLLEIVNIAEIDQDPKIDVSKIAYGGVGLSEIFKDNEKNKEKDKTQKVETFVTFKAVKVIRPLTPKYIAYGCDGNRAKNQMVDCVECKFKVNEKLRNYIKPDDSDYAKLDLFAQEAFSDKQNWAEVKDKVTSVDVKELNECRTTPGEIYGISNLELPYSNAFRFFIEKYPQMLSGFCMYLQQKNDKCNLLNGICDYFSRHANHKLEKVKREWKNIDLLIEVDNEWVIVVENKIFSDLNGKKEEITQLDTYKDTVAKEYKNWNRIFILLLPDHNDIDISSYSNWHKLYYSSVSEYLKVFIKERNDAGLKEDMQLEDFAAMVEQHSDKDYNLGVMKRRFERALRTASKTQDKK